MAVDTLSLSGKTALVTGSGRENGIGAAIARAFARNGAAVAIHYSSEPSKARANKVAAGIASEFGVKTTVVQGSVDNQASAKSIVEQALKGLGADHIDILVNNAGWAAPDQALLEATPEDLHHEFGVNVFGTIYMTQAAIIEGKMPRGGRIINVDSIASKTSAAINPIYNASKSAQDSLTASWAGEIGHTHGVTVNTLAPGPIPTDMSQRFLELPDGSMNQGAAIFKDLARAEKRFGTVEDMADIALLLVSEKSRWITAQWISVDGGAVTGAR
ncbi:putative short-chain dehydrogenase [Hypoxylon crocopeplum]|nr:putative short-chain dehydrogenase [Hypoxylon crocopeplum]